MDNEKFWKEVEKLAKTSPQGKIKATFTYVTGDKEVFEYESDVRPKFLWWGKQRNKYHYYKNTLINLDHVVKIHFEEKQ